MKWFKENMIIIIMTAIIGLIGSLGAALWANQEKKIDSKADEKSVVQMIQKMEAVREITINQAKEERAEQKELNKEQQKINNELILQLMLLRKQLEKETP